MFDKLCTLMSDLAGSLQPWRGQDESKIIKIPASLSYTKQDRVMEHPNWDAFERKRWDFKRLPLGHLGGSVR